MIIGSDWRCPWTTANKVFSLLKLVKLEKDKMMMKTWIILGHSRELHWLTDWREDPRSVKRPWFGPGFLVDVVEIVDTVFYSVSSSWILTTSECSGCVFVPLQHFIKRCDTRDSYFQFQMSSTTFSTWYSIDLQANAERIYFEGKTIVNLERILLSKAKLFSAMSSDAWFILF